MASVVWLHGGACNGNTQSFLDAEEPTVVDLVTDFGINVIYHHSFIPLAGEQAKDALLNSIKDGGPDIFVFEGSVIQGPNGSGRYDIFLGPPDAWSGFATSRPRPSSSSRSATARAGAESRRPNPIRPTRSVFSISRPRTAASSAAISAAKPACP